MASTRRRSSAAIIEESRTLRLAVQQAIESAGYARIAARETVARARALMEKLNRRSRTNQIPDESPRQRFADHSTIAPHRTAHDQDVRNRLNEHPDRRSARRTKDGRVPRRVAHASRVEPTER